jgi:hypothetical protein
MIDTKTDKIFINFFPKTWGIDIKKAYVYNKVCIRCEKCFNEIEEWTKKLEEAVLNEVAENKWEKKKKQIAQDLWDEKCKKN